MSRGNRDDPYSFRENHDATGAIVGIVIVCALLAIGYLIFSANPDRKPRVIDDTSRPFMTECVMHQPISYCWQAYDLVVDND